MWVRAYFAIVLFLLPTAAFAQMEKRVALDQGPRQQSAAYQTPSAGRHLILYRVIGCR